MPNSRCYFLTMRFSQHPRWTARCGDCCLREQEDRCFPYTWDRHDGWPHTGFLTHHALKRLNLKGPYLPCRFCSHASHFVLRQKVKKTSRWLAHLAQPTTAHPYSRHFVTSHNCQHVQGTTAHVGYRTPHRFLLSKGERGRPPNKTQPSNRSND